MTKFDEALHELRYQCHEVGFVTNGGASVYKSSPEEIAAESAVRAIHEADVALAQQLATALVAFTMENGGECAYGVLIEEGNEEHNEMCEECRDVLAARVALLAAKAAGVEVP